MVDLDLIGDDLQQCIDAIIRLRAEYLWSRDRADEVQFSYSCCREMIPWSRWKDGWRTKIVEKGGRETFEWQKTHGPDGSRENFVRYLFWIMVYAGTWSLSVDMLEIDAGDVTIGDAYIQGGLPGLGHGVMILDMAVAEDGRKVMLLGQSFVPAQDFHVLDDPGNPLSPWFEVDFGEQLVTPSWDFTAAHARRFR